MKYINKESIIKVKTYTLAHKLVSTIIILVIALGGWYTVKAMSGSTSQTRYVLGTVSTSTIISTVSASGQVSASNEVNIKAKVSGEITWINVEAGDTVYAGQALMGIDSTDAKQAIVDAEQSLKTSKLQYQQSEAEAPIDYQKALDNLESAKEDLDTTFNDTFNSLSSTYLDLPTVITYTQNIIHGYDLSSSGSQWNIDVLKGLFNNEDDKAKIEIFAKSAESDYATARAKYDASIIAYKKVSRSSSDEDIEELLNETIETTTALAQALQSELNFLGSVTDTAQSYNQSVPSAVTTMKTNARTYLSTVNSDLSNLLSQKKSITSSKQSIKTYEQDIELLKIGNDTGSNPISLQISKANIESAEQNLAELKADLSNYTITAPFSGLISAVDVKKGDTASGAVATIITKQQVAVLTLNEVDAAKVEVGNKVTLTFDAVEDLTMTGVVSEKDSVGTVTSGVVSYDIKISFDTQNDQISSGMTVNAVIQTAVHQDTITVPSSAVKTKNGTSYVLIFDPALSDIGDSQGVISDTAPTQVTVTTGISDDTSIEILSGLTVGQQIVTKTVTGSSSSKTTTTSSTKTTTTSASSLLGGSSGSAGGPPSGAPGF